jgi:hypothetical protein
MIAKVITTASSEDNTAIEEMHRHLEEQGLLEPFNPSESPDPFPDFEPIVAKGKPLSEIIIEDRN